MIPAYGVTLRGFTVTHIGHTTLGGTSLDETSSNRRDLWQHTTLAKDEHPCPGGNQIHNPSKREGAYPCLRTLGHWDRSDFLQQYNMLYFVGESREIKNSTGILNVPQTLSSVKWSDPEYEQSFFAKVKNALSCTSVPHTSCDVLNFAFEWKRY